MPVAVRAVLLVFAIGCSMAGSGLAFVTPAPRTARHMNGSFKFNLRDGRGHLAPSGGLPRERIVMMSKEKRDSAEIIGSVTDTETAGTGAEVDEEDEREGAEGGNAVYSLDRLKAEASAPFRKVRLFIYGGFGASALIGGLTALTQLTAALSNQPGALELKDVFVNLAVDFGVVGASLFCYNFEINQEKALEQAQADARLQKDLLKKNKIDTNVNADRVAQLRGLTVRLAESAGPTREAPVGVLMDQAKQSFVVVAGDDEALRDTMLSALMAKNQIFQRLNALVVPVNLSPGGGGGEGGGRGFGAPKKSPQSFSEQGYVAEPVDAPAWRELMLKELEAAELQGAGKEAKKGGIVLVVGKDSRVLRRGVGTPVWTMIKDDIDPPAKP